MSVYTRLCDAILAELASAVPSLTGVENVHRYTPFSVESLLADGETHLAVWTVTDQANEEAQPMTTGSMLVRYPIGISYWEPCEEGDDLRANEDAAARLSETLEDVRTVLTRNSFRNLEGGILQWVGSVMETCGAQASGSVRWWVAELSVSVPVAYAA